jgi:fatty-acyl-CoA synthase
VQKSYTRGPAATLLETNIWQALLDTASRFPDRPALIVRHEQLRLTWSQLVAAAERLAWGLTGLGLQPQDRLGMWASNCSEWVLLQLACARIGVVLVNVNPAYRSAELRYILERSGMKALVLRESGEKSNYREILESAVASGPLALCHVLYLKHPSWDAMLDAGRDPGPVSVPNTAVTNIQYTSGTTGSPKGVLLTHRNLLNNGRFIAAGLKVTEEDGICVPVPFYHCFGCVGGTMVALTTGCAMVMASASFDALAVMQAIQAERCTILYGVPTMFIAQLDHPRFAEFDFSSLRTGIMAGAPCPVEVMKRVVSDMSCPEMTILYGQTELSPAVTMSAVTDPIELRVATVGAAMPETEIKIVGANGETVPAGEQGELCARGYVVMAGYDGDPQATARTVDPEGWLHTGDLAVMRPDGYFRITGRIKDMIIRGGENVYPREIEEFFYSHPAISDVQVFGVPDVKMGEQVAAWVRLRAGATLTEEELRSYAKGRIAHYKIPAIIRFVDTFPTTVTGKIQKFRMRQLEVEASGLHTAAAVETA